MTMSVQSLQTIKISNGMCSVYLYLCEDMVVCDADINVELLLQFIKIYADTRMMNAWDVY